ncbi:MAG TPA: TIGR03621 family F420-dependent LLM class oxidoreductase [Actinomycetes bacterium]|jgi:probable F420-dependent oxidoreductase|nr:TIGR03621 family F420-dependent LLM class oxidoreductase [Actinomycetes bacterium]
MADPKRPFRFGVVGESIRSGEQLLATARRAEDLGYSTLVLRDHFVGEPFGDQLAPLVALTAAASATRTLRIGTQVLDNDYRHPVLLAKEAATLDVLSGGRLELGIGAGWLREEYDLAGMPFAAAGVRVSRLEESLEVLKGLFSGSAFTFRGAHYQVNGLASFPRPAQRPHPPMLVGAGSRRMLGIAGRHADIVGILPKALPDGTISGDLSERSPQAVARKVEWVRQAAGERFGAVELSMMVSVIVAPDHWKVAERLAAKWGWVAAAAERVLEMPSLLIGSPDRIAEEMQVRRDRYGFSYYVISDQDVEAFGPVVDRLCGC